MNTFDSKFCWIEDGIEECDDTEYVDDTYDSGLEDYDEDYNVEESSDDSEDYCHDDDEDQFLWEVHYCAPCKKRLPKCCKFGQAINIRSRSCNEITNLNASENFFKGKYLHNVIS